MDDIEQRAETLAREFGERLRRRRRQMGMTQADLALSAGVGRQFVIAVEKGSARSPIGYGLLMADVLGMPLDPKDDAAPSSGDDLDMPDPIDEDDDHAPSPF